MTVVTIRRVRVTQPIQPSAPDQNDPYELRISATLMRLLLLAFSLTRQETEGHCLAQWSCVCNRPIRRSSMKAGLRYVS
ncbi:hypothetical protein SLA2020_428660 [Shorea laevis]